MSFYVYTVDCNSAILLYGAISKVIFLQKVVYDNDFTPIIDIYFYETFSTLNSNI